MRFFFNKTLELYPRIVDICLANLPVRGLLIGNLKLIAMYSRIFFGLLCVGMLNISTLNAQEEADSLKYWKTGGDVSLTFSQVSLNNWAAGGRNSVSGNFLFNTIANYAKNKSAWDNSLTIGYGLSQQGSDNLIKTDDRLLLTSKYGYKASDKWFYTALLDFKTQMTTGYQDPPTNSVVISELLSPAYLQFSLGMDYKPNDQFSLYISPLTSKHTIVADNSLSNAGAYGVDPGDKMRSEFGASLKSVYKKENIIKGVDFFTRLDLFSNLVDNPDHIDVDWEGRLNMKINDYLTAVFSLQLLYDHDTKTTEIVGDIPVERGAKLQSKQLLGFGLSYKF